VAAELTQAFEYQPEYLNPRHADRLLRRLWNELEWQRYAIRLFGRLVQQPRLTAWCADAGVLYTYSGLTLESAPWHPALAALRTRLQRDCGAGFNSVLANAYRDGRDSMGWHADDEPELGDCPIIASVSLGAERRLLMRPRQGGASQRLNLAHGSLLLMRGRCQADWLHSLPRTRKPVGPRINLTYRQVLRQASC
jgi:alkylated DNA repair dioxygenase AlkB